MRFIDAKTPAEWRAWLRKNHVRESRVLLVRHRKHTGKPSFSNQEAMDEAICYGWIDTTLKRVDDDRYGVTYVKRGKSSRWSHNTVSHAERLITAGKMTPAGLAAYEEGRQRPLLERFPKRVPVPDELRKALATSGKARDFFDRLAPGYRRIYTVMVAKGKRPETREKWAAIVAQRCRDGKRPPDP